MKPAGDIRLYARLAQCVRSTWPHLAGLLALGALASPLALLVPVPLKIAVDSVLGGRALPGWLAPVVPQALSRNAMGLLVLAGLLAVVVAVLTGLQALGTKYLTAVAGERQTLEFRTRLFRHLERLSLTYHDATGSADAMYRIQTDAPTIRNIVVDGFIPSVTAAVTLAGMLYVTARIDWQLALIALAVSPPLLLVTRYYRPRLRQHQREVRRLDSAALAVIHEALGAMRVVRAFGQEEREVGRFGDRAGRALKGKVRLSLAEGGFNLLVSLVVAGGTALVLFVGISHVRAGLLSLGDLLLVMGYVAKLYDPMKTISQKLAMLQGHLASMERAFAVLDLAPDVVERPAALPLQRANGAVAFRDVSFGYGPDRPALSHISFEVEPGRRLGIVGSTGSGKTTLISLLVRLYDPTEGQILLDGVDLRHYKLDDLRRAFAVVFQDTVLFSVSVGENIAYARPGAAFQDIVAAAKAAHAHEFIERLPRGYDTEVGERGVQLSGGQRQRIALARAFLKDAPVLILDEPTSAVDVATETTILEAMDRLMKGRTAFVITHRPSALVTCDARLHIERGWLVESPRQAICSTS